MLELAVKHGTRFKSSPYIEIRVKYMKQKVG